MNMTTLLAAGFSAGMIFLAHSSAKADHVRLENPANGIFISGELLEFSNQVYMVRTAVGDIAVPADKVRCTSNECPSHTSFDAFDLTIAGSDTIGTELMPLLLKGYGFSMGGVARDEMIADRTRVLEVLRDGQSDERLFVAKVEDHGSSTGFTGLLSGAAEIGMSSRPAKPAEIDEFQNAGFGNLSSFEQEHSIAVDGLLIVVHPDNTVSDLTFEQISKLLSGQITNWAELGGPDLPVNVYSRDEKSGTFATISGRFLEPFTVALSVEANIVPGNAEMSEAVFSDPGAIGYVGFAFRGDTKAVGLMSSCGIAVDPSAFAAKTGEYPLQRQLYLYTRNQPLSPHAEALLEFTKSAAADEMIEKSGFLAFGIDAQNQDDLAATVRSTIEETESPSEAALLRELFIDLLEWERLSPTFRFRSGSTTLDNASRRDLARLRDFLVTAEPGTIVQFVGFTDSDGPLEANLRLGQQRAESVYSELMAILSKEDIAHLEIGTKGYGEINPVACNDAFEGQRLNRRVETWIRTP